MTHEWPARDDEHTAVVELVDRILADTPDGGPDDTDDVPVAERPARALLVQQGLYSVAISEAAGGGGAGLPVLVAVLERLGRTRPALGLACAHAHAAARVLAVHPGWRECAHEVAGGAPIALVDAAAVQLDGDGDRVLRGAPVRVDVGAPDPALLLVEPGGTGHCVLVPSGSASVATGPPLRRTGLAGAATRWIAFPGTHPLGPGAVAEGVRGRCGLALLHLQVAALACGIAAGALDAATRYVGEREQFGAPLAALPTVQRAVFDAHTALQAAQHQVAGLAATRSAGADAVDPVAAAAALRSATEMAVQVATAGVQLHGGYGYLTDYPAERFLRDAISLRAAAATSAVARGAATRLLPAAS
jgi:alkylation response protein AidB-like acyl-CoA dehydrogenase